MVLFTAISTTLTYAQNSSYYYFEGEQIHLDQNLSYVNIIVNSSFDHLALASLPVEPFELDFDTRERNGELKKWAKIEFSNSPENISDYDLWIDQLQSINGIEGVYPYFDAGTSFVGTSNYFNVELKNPSDLAILESQALAMNVTIEGPAACMPAWYILSMPDSSSVNSLEMASLFYETGLFESTSPAFVFQTVEGSGESVETAFSGDLEVCDVEDPHAINQWNLFNNPEYPEADINICGAWAITKGSNSNFGPSRIAMIDTGVEANHQDMLVSQHVLTSGPLGSNPPFYYTTGGLGFHGTWVGGIINAQHNTTGPAGVAPESVFYSMANMVLHSLNQLEMADAITCSYSNTEYRADVINMSFAKAVTTPVSDLANAIDGALNQGRNGKGTVLVASAGNVASLGIQFPANQDGVISVGSHTDIGEYGDNAYGTVSAPLDLSGPAGSVPTTALNNSYTNNSYGTSTAAPHISGIAALMIAANYGISGEAVGNIMKRTAQKSGEEHPYIEVLFPNYGPYNNYLGFGVPDATASVRTALEFETESGVVDLHMRNSRQDYGKEPDNATRHANFVLWDSPDIWVKNNGSTTFYGHENPIYTGSGTTVDVRVRVINKSNQPVSAGDHKVKLYWSIMGSNTTSWPHLWNGTTEMVNSGGQEVVVGEQIGNISGENIPAIRPGQQGIVSFEWTLPNPEDFEGIFDCDPFENGSCGFSLYARIISNDDPMTYEELTLDSNGNGIPDTGNVWVNARNNNNIAWKNVEIVSETSPSILAMSGSIPVSNLSESTNTYNLEFSTDSDMSGAAIHEEAEVQIHLDTDLYNDWSANGAVKTNFESSNGSFIVAGDEATINNISLGPGESNSIPITFNFLSSELTNKETYKYHVVLRDVMTEDIVMGKTFYIHKGVGNSFDADAGDDEEINKNESITMSAVSINEPAMYNWYDADGNLLYSGQDMTIAPESTQVYTLEVIKESDGLKDYDDVTIQVNPYVLELMAPNPASDHLTVEYIAEDASSAYIRLQDINMLNEYNHVVNTLESSTTIDISNYPTGIYLVSLICDGNLIDTLNLVIE